MARKGYRPLYIEIPEDLWKQFAMACLKNDKNRTEVTIQLIKKFVKESK